MATSRLFASVLAGLVSVPLLACLPVAVAQEDAPARPARRPAQPEPPKAPQPPAEPERPAAEAMRWLENIELVQNVVYATVPDRDGNEHELQLDAAFPKQGGDAPLPAIIYIHGGGWSGGHRSAGLPFTIAYANGGYFACTISYRLSGEATYPAAVHDCKAAVRFLRANAEELGIDPERIGVWGHSAGGHLSAMIGLTGDDPALEGSVGATGVSTEVACFVSVCGPSQLPGLTINGMVSDFLGEGSEEEVKSRAEQASPVTHVDRHDPPALLVHGTADELVSIRQAQLLNAALRGAGATCELHEVEGAGHAIRDKEAYERIAAFFDEHLGGSALAVMQDVDWDRLSAIRPSAPDAPSPPRRARGEGNADRTRPEAPPAGNVNIPQPLDPDAIKTMPLDDVRDAMAEIAVAMRRSDALDAETKERLKNEFRMLRNRLRELEKQ